jgi:hypothetical protein
MRIGSFASMLGPLDDACHQLTKNVCPLFVLEGRRRPILIGSAVPVQIGRVSLLVTAAHVLEGYGGASVLTLLKNRSMMLSGERRGFGYKPGRHVDVDLAVIILSNEERQEIASRYCFSYSLEFAATGRMKDITFYALAGYPQSRNRRSPQLLKGAVVANYFISRSQLPLSAIRSRDKLADVHFAIGANAKGAIGVDGSRTGFPSPFGLSGGGVWRLSFPKDPFALPKPHLVGIGIEYCVPPGAFVCTRIEHVLPMVSDLCSDRLAD